MTKKWIALFLLLLFGAILDVSAVQAEVKYNIGLNERLRQEIWDDVVGLNVVTTPSPNGSTQDRTWFRLRTSPWFSADIDQNYGAYLRLTNEMQYQIGPFRRNAKEQQLYADELIFDNLYADAKKIFGLPIDVRVGRQDFLGPNVYGEGFLIMDGTPGDGSRTFYFNAAKITFRFDQKNSMDLVFLSDPWKDIYLPSLHQDNSKRFLEVSNEQAIFAYGRIKGIDNLTLEPYYIYKVEESYTANMGGGKRVTVPRLGLNTIGARAVYALNAWNFGGELAYQFGSYSGGADRTGIGGYAFVSRKYDTTTLKPEFDLRYVYLSGDDSSDINAKRKAWDPLFSRNPYWNEIMIYNFPIENPYYSNATTGGVAGYWTNIELIKLSVKLNFTPDTNLLLSYQYLWAPEKPTVPSPLVSDGKSRGSLPIGVLSHRFSKAVDGFLQLEYFIPGSFYNSNADNSLFFRWQLNFKI